MSLDIAVKEIERTEPAVELADDGSGRLDIRMDGQPFTTYHYAGEGNRPFLYPLLGPHGAGITRNYPMRPDEPGESKAPPAPAQPVDGARRCQRA